MSAAFPGRGAAYSDLESSDSDRASGVATDVDEQGGRGGALRAAAFTLGVLGVLAGALLLAASLRGLVPGASAPELARSDFQPSAKVSVGLDAPETAATVAALPGAGTTSVVAPPAPASAPSAGGGGAGAAAPLQALRPEEHLHDGNTCQDNEERLAGLCYRRCSELTNGTHPVRGSAFSCCRSDPCTLLNQHAESLLPCHGYDVSGDGSCPHVRGACLVDEELSLGMCYKKCSLLTGGEYPHRVAALTCCKASGAGCLDLREDLTSGNFGVGGGRGDRDPATPRAPHFPMKILTETVA